MDPTRRGRRASSAGVSRIGTTRERTSRHATSSFEVVRRYEVSLAAIHSLEEAHVRIPKSAHHSAGQ